MNDTQILMLRQVRARAKELEAPAYGYPMVSVRSVAESLGFDREQIASILDACAEGGFNYCCDTTIAHNTGAFPPEFACQWGPDQLRSRLDCIDYRVYAETVVEDGEVE